MSDHSTTTVTRQVARAARLSVVIPVFNERRTIEEILKRVQAVDVDKEIIIVDHGSTDGTTEFLRELIEQGWERSMVLLPRAGGCMRADNLRVFFQGRN